MSKYLKYKEEIVSLWNEGLGFITIADILIKKYNFSVSTDHFRKTIAKIIKNGNRENRNLLSSIIANGITNTPINVRIITQFALMLFSF